jgi:CRP-like cAMP-binding protein
MNATTFGNSGSEIPFAVAVGQAPLTGRAGASPGNRILAALPRDALSSLLPYLKPEFLPRGRVLCDIDESLRHVYFVERGLVSMVAVFADRTTAEMATVGREGLVGVGNILGGEHALARYVVPMPALALAIEASRFRGALRDSPELRATCNAYAQAFLGEALQTAACNSVHMVEERCARWLLMSHDRSDDDTLALTQEYLADMLGVCRSTVTLAAGALQRAGLIRYRRGAITVLDRLGLEAASCECYRVIREQYERLLPRSGERQSSRQKLSLVCDSYAPQSVG